MSKKNNEGKFIKLLEEQNKKLDKILTILSSGLIKQSIVSINRRKNYANQSNEEMDVDVSMNELAKYCKISVDKLDDVVNLKDDYVQIISPIAGKEAEKQVKTSMCVLILNEIVLKRKWTPSVFLSKSLDKSGVGDLVHLSRTLKKNSNIIRSKGLARGTEYKLLGPGRIKAFDLIKQLAEKGTG